MAEITKEKLKEMYCEKGMTMKEIGEHFNCSFSNISYHIRKHKLSKKRNKLKGKYINCRVCGKEFYVKPTKIGERKYCSPACQHEGMKGKQENRRKGKYLECKYCGKEFYVQPCKVEETKYCSRECRSKDERVNKITKECKYCRKKFKVYPSYEDMKYCSKKCCDKDKLKGKYINCKNCGKEFYIRPSEFGERKYCSRECNWDSLKNRVECECVICGEKFEVQNWTYENYNTKCCSQECLNKWYRRPEFMTGIEELTYDALEKSEIDFEMQKYLDGWRFDFYLPNYNLFIEIDGDYWHGNTQIYNKLNSTQIENAERDKRKDKWCKNNGYNIERIWGNDIKENAERYVKEAIGKYQTNESKAVVL